MVCNNCGGEFADWALKCPYCDSVNEEASEKAYMDHMNSIRDRLDDIDDNAKAKYMSEIKSSTRKSLKTALKILVIALAAALGFIAISAIYDIIIFWL